MCIDHASEREVLPETKAIGIAEEPERKPAQDVRKTVTFLFADVVDSSRLSLTLDPETLHNLFARYFDGMNSAIRRHGGNVEKLIGDEIMAAFGHPMRREDDALRAVRAAVEMREALAKLNNEFEASWGVQLAHRVGINTGEVITGDDRQGQRFLAGEAVRVAKRLEEAAAPDEILIGESTHRLVRDAVVSKLSGPRALKHGEKFHAFIVISIAEHAPGIRRRFEAPFVGRGRQREMIDTIFRDVIRHRTCHLLTILGDAGVGKSRLVLEIAASLPGDTLVARGRCLPYGEGITYRPLADIFREITKAEGLDLGKQSVAKIAENLAGDKKAGLITETVAELLGFGGGKSGKGEETFWAVRRLFESLARERPLVIVVDDLHWAESMFLDLIEHLVDLTHGFPILIVAIARPELLDTRPGWGSGRSNATTVVLEPLSEAESREMLSNLLDHVPLQPAVESTITAAADGNPLFAEEFVAMLVDEKLLTREKDNWVARGDLSDLPRVPSTIDALLGARLDRLPEHERAILTMAAIEGLVFHRSAVVELARPVPNTVVDDGLLALVRQDLIRPGSPDFSGEEAYHFRHVLIRDAAYRSLSKHLRAELHERFAAWLEMKSEGHLREFDEIVGYHFEQAFQYRVALDSQDPLAASLAAQAAPRLEAAARRALGRSHLSSAITLLERLCVAVPHLLPSQDSRRRTLLAELGRALVESGRLTEAERALQDAEQLATIANDERAASHVLVEQQFLRLLRVEEGGDEEAARAITLVIPVFNRYKDNLGLCRARRLEALLYWNEARAEAAEEAWKRAAVHARLAGDQHVYNEILAWIASALWFGPTPANKGIRRCKAMLKKVRDSPESEAAILRHLGGLYGMVGQFELARHLLATSNAAYAELGFKLDAAMSQNEAVVELLAGNPAAAEESLRTGYRALEEMGERMFRPTTAAFLARAVLEQGREEEAEELAELSAQLAAKGDLLSQILWRGVRARVLARHAQFEEAEALAREAVALAQVTDFVNHRADALLDLARVLKASLSIDEAVTSASEALRLYELKGNHVSASATRSWLERLTRD
jgi:predicted ATPase/class 3 adenylate cyclase